MDGKRFGYSSKREYFPAVTTEQSWVWDVEENNQPSLRSARPTKKKTTSFWDDSEEVDYPIHSRYPSFGQRHPGHNQLTPGGFKKGKNFFAHFEDPHFPNKNCPPSFSVEFDLPNSIEPEPPQIVKDIVLPPSSRYTPTTTPSPVLPDATEATTIAVPELPADIVPTISANAMEALENQRAEKMKLINSDLCGISINTRIIGGDDAGINQFPWMARLAYRNKSEYYAGKKVLLIYVIIQFEDGVRE